MALYFKFRSAKEFSSLPICGHYISVGELKDLIFESKIGRGKDFDLVITNAQTNEDYIEESALITANTSVLIRRIPGWPRNPIVVNPVPAEDESDLKEEGDSAEETIKKGAFIMDTPEWDEFFSSSSGNSLNTISTVTTVDDEKSKLEKSDINASVDKRATELKKDSGFNPFGSGGVMGRKMGRNIPPDGYVCHRCKVAGHFIQHCPTNGDPNYDVKKVRAPRGIPKSMLVAASDGLYGLADGRVADLKPDEAAFEREVEGMPSKRRPVGDIPKELHCKLCKKVMEFAVIPSKCCFDSFCDKCIRNYIITNSKCFCGATNILADHLVPNLTLRNTINRILECDKSDGSSNVETNDASEVLSQYVGSDKEVVVPSMKAKNEEAIMVSTKAKKEEAVVASMEAEKKVSVVSTKAKNEEAVVAKMEGKKKVSVVSTKVKDEEAVVASIGEKKKESPSNAGELQWPAAHNYMNAMGFAAYNPYWSGGIQSRMGGFINPSPYAGSLPYMSYGVGHLDMSYGGILQPDKFSRTPKMSSGRGEFVARKAPKRKHENEENGKEVYNSKTLKTYQRLCRENSEEHYHY